MKTRILLRAVLLLSLASTPAMAQDSPEKYTFEPGFDRPGADYQTFEQTSAYQLHELCRDACYSQPKCQSHTFANIAPNKTEIRSTMVDIGQAS